MNKVEAKKTEEDPVFGRPGREGQLERDAVEALLALNSSLGLSERDGIKRVFNIVVVHRFERCRRFTYLL